MDQANEIELIRHRRQLAADCMRGDEKSAIRHGHENAAEAPRAYNGFSLNGNNPLNFVSHSKGAPQNGSVIGHGGWDAFNVLFSGGNGIIYAVDAQGNLIFYRDNNQNGTGEVANGSVIGHGGWIAFKALFSGGNGGIYATLPMP